MPFSDEKPLATTDGLTVVFSKAEGGKIKLGSRAWDNGETILPDQVLEVRMRQGQIIFLRRGRKPDPTDLPKQAAADDPYGEFVEYTYPSVTP